MLSKIQFVNFLSILFISIGMAACGGGNTNTQTTGSVEIGITDAPVDSAEAVVIHFTEAALHGPDGTTPAQAKECVPTPHRTTGTHYAPVTVEKTNISKGVIFTGRILNTACQLVSHAKVAHWQAGKDGRYTDRLRAFLYTDEAGFFIFETEWPNLNPPHIHFIITAEGYYILETQWIGSSPQTHIEFDMVLEEK